MHGYCIMLLSALSFSFVKLEGFIFCFLKQEACVHSNRTVSDTCWSQNCLWSMQVCISNSMTVVQLNCSDSENSILHVPLMLRTGIQVFGGIQSRYFVISQQKSIKIFCQNILINIHINCQREEIISTLCLIIYPV